MYIIYIYIYIYIYYIYIYTHSKNLKNNNLLNIFDIVDFLCEINDEEFTGVKIIEIGSVVVEWVLEVEKSAIFQTTTGHCTLTEAKFRKKPP